MPKYIPAWAYGKFQIVPDRHEETWNIKEKRFGFFFKWRYWYNIKTMLGFQSSYIRSYISIDEAKAAIDRAIKIEEEKKRHKKNMKYWRKKKAIEYP